MIFIKDILTAKKVFIFNEIAEKIAAKFFSESMTLILEKDPKSKIKIADNLNQNHDKFLGFRIVNHKFVTNLLEAFDGVLAVTSANISGQEPAINAPDVEKYFSDSSLDLLVDGGVCKKKIASTVIKITEQKVEILRQGAMGPTQESSIKSLGYDT